VIVVSGVIGVALIVRAGVRHRRGGGGTTPDGGGPEPEAGAA
jgi:hypothetical protein